MTLIAFLKGKLAGKTETTALVEVAGVGYAVGMSQAGLSKLPEIGSTLEVQTYMQVREDGLALFGFLSIEEKALFERLISVGGVGPKVALAALSVFTPQGLASVITSEDVASVSKIPGVGKKTASRIILELKGSLDKGIENLFGVSEVTGQKDVELRGAHEALLSMGFTAPEADLALKGAPQDVPERSLLQYALKRLGA